MGGEVVSGVPVESWLLGAYFYGFPDFALPKMVLSRDYFDIVHHDIVLVGFTMFANRGECSYLSGMFFYPGTERSTCLTHVLTVFHELQILHPKIAVVNVSD